MNNSHSKSYAAVGVDIEAGYKGVQLMREHVERTMIPGVVSGIGGFGGLFAPDLSGMKEPILVSGTDGVIAAGYTDEALEILKTKCKGGYNVVKIDPDYTPTPIERRNIFGITFEQGYNDLTIDEKMLEHIVTENRDLPQQAKHDMILSLITLKYTQSNSVCYVKNGMTIGVGAGQQSRIHCTRLAGSKADTWHLRQHPKTLALPFIPTLSRPERDNIVDSYINGNEEDVCADGVWHKYFWHHPERLTCGEARAWLDNLKEVSLASDAFFPFADNIERARRSGVRYVAEPGGSIRDDLVISKCNDYDMVMAFTGLRLFHH